MHAPANLRRAALCYAVLLLLPALGLGGGALVLLRREAKRWQLSARDALRDRARLTAERITAALDLLESRIRQRLRELPKTGAAAALFKWQSGEPLVRNGFVWLPRERLVMPDPDRLASDEERRFVRRYQALFSSEVPWHAPSRVDEVGGGYHYSPLPPVTALSRHDAQPPVAGQGRRTWFSDDALSVLVWVQPGADGEIRGVELEMMALLSRLTPTMPVGVPPQVAFVLRDGSGRAMLQAGEFEVPEDGAPEVVWAVGPALPHWDIAVYAAAVPGAARSGALFAVAAMLGVAMVAAIGSGATLLLRDTRRQALDASRKTTFVSNVSHELRTPLTNIRLYAELLLAGRAADDGKRQHYLSVIGAECQRLTRLVDNVLDFSRLEQGRKNYALTAIDLGTLAAAVVGRHRERCRGAGVALRDVAPPRPVHAYADRDAVEQILINLVDNAVKYAGDGGEISVTVALHDGTAVLTVMDRGPGLPSSEAERAFAMFHRLDDSLTAKQPGCGLGLALARRLARDMSGDLIYEPRQGGGACFRLDLPLSTPTEPGRETAGGERGGT